MQTYDEYLASMREYKFIPMHFVVWAHWQVFYAKKAGKNSAVTPEVLREAAKGMEERTLSGFACVAVKTAFGDAGGEDWIAYNFISAALKAYHIPTDGTWGCGDGVLPGTLLLGLLRPMKAEWLRLLAARIEKCNPHLEVASQES